MTKPGSWGKPVVSPDGRTRRVHRLCDRRAARTPSAISSSSRSVAPARATACGRSAATSIASRSTCAGRRTAPASTSTPTITARSNVHVRVDHRRRQAGHQRPAHADLRLGVEGSRRRRHVGRSGASAGRRPLQPAGSRARSPSSPTSTATCCRASSSRRSKRSDLHLVRQRQGAGLGREAAVLRRVEEVSADPRDSRRAVRELQRRLQLHVPELRGERLRGALHEPARQHRLRQRVHQRHRSRLSRAPTTTI